MLDKEMPYEGHATAITLRQMGFDGRIIGVTGASSWHHVVLVPCRHPSTSHHNARLHFLPPVFTYKSHVPLVLFLAATAGNALEEDRQAFMAAGANAVVIKPVRQANLETQLRGLGLYLPKGSLADPAGAAAMVLGQPRAKASDAAAPLTAV